MLVRQVFLSGGIVSEHELDVQRSGAGRVDEPKVPCIVGVYVVHKPIRRIRIIEKRKTIEKVCT
jgi:hypothetical protein